MISSNGNTISQSVFSPGFFEGVVGGGGGGGGGGAGIRARRWEK